MHPLIQLWDTIQRSGINQIAGSIPIAMITAGIIFSFLLLLLLAWNVVLYVRKTMTRQKS